MANAIDGVNAGNFNDDLTTRLGLTVECITSELSAEACDKRLGDVIPAVEFSSLGLIGPRPIRLRNLICEL